MEFIIVGNKVVSKVNLVCSKLSQPMKSNRFNESVKWLFWSYEIMMNGLLIFKLASNRLLNLRKVNSARMMKLDQKTILIHTVIYLMKILWEVIMLKMGIVKIKKNPKKNKKLTTMKNLQKMVMKKIIKSSSKRCNNASVPTRQLGVKTKESITSKRMKEIANQQQCQFKVK